MELIKEKTIKSVYSEAAGKQKSSIISSPPIEPFPSSSNSFTHNTRGDHETSAVSSKAIADELEPLLTVQEAIDNDSLIPDPYLLVNMSLAQPPPRPKLLIILFLLACVDLGIVAVCTILLVHIGPWNAGDWRWDYLEWDMLGLGLLRVITVIGVDSSLWLRELGWILGGVCGGSSIYIIFKANVLYQHKRPTHIYHITLLVTSCLFCVIHLISYIIVTTDKRRREALLRDESIEFHEEPYLPEVDHIDCRDVESGNAQRNHNRSKTSRSNHSKRSTKTYGSFNIAHENINAGQNDIVGDSSVQ
ncbi:hypothetical protein G9A89_012204 [Geosiphon pyriformis]|nr:hypothetical protein G9A89_012204 [Geosiphon pyriformis]